MSCFKNVTEMTEKISRLQQPYIEEEDIIGKYLFENIYIEETKKDIYKFLDNQREEKER